MSPGLAPLLLQRRFQQGFGCSDLFQNQTDPDQTENGSGSGSETSFNMIPALKLVTGMTFKLVPIYISAILTSKIAF
jgi:hypothetical protein